MPPHEYYEYFGPDYTLHVAPSNMENKNSRQLLEDIRTKLLENLSKLRHAPSIQFQERPPETELPEGDEDQEDADERWDPDSDMEVDEDRKPLATNTQISRVKKESVEPEHKEEDDAGYAVGPTTAEDTRDTKALDLGSMSLDEPVSVKVEQENMNKPSDQPAQNYSSKS